MYNIESKCLKCDQPNPSLPDEMFCAMCKSELKNNRYNGLKRNRIKLFPNDYPLETSGREVYLLENEINTYVNFKKS